MIKDFDDIRMVLDGINNIDVNEMSLVDKMLFAFYAARFAEDIKPLVEKYASVKDKKIDLFDELLQFLKESKIEPCDTMINPEDDEVDDAED